MNIKIKKIFFETFLVIETDQGYKIFEEVLLDKSGMRQGLGGLMVKELQVGFGPPPISPEEMKASNEIIKGDAQERALNAVSLLANDLSKTKRYAY